MPRHIENQLSWLVELYGYSKLNPLIVETADLMFEHNEIKVPFHEQDVELFSYQYWACIQMLYEYENLILVRA